MSDKAKLTLSEYMDFATMNLCCSGSMYNT